ncbi:nucleic-acid-binding protein from mobile element jockey [Elysia marginata]|uniref:Nucleic-acid-binding protein from mobile element jockey n=1 Tax=Elysia marginata TaxID=1093978 RepID=A0AAV4F5U5_9GAST|nr:nucleic-acid-binding protein from mobile element jockey [Elysia marginata]
MRCFRCHRYGHGRNKCRAKEELCVRCGEPGHGSEECKRDVRCVNCKGDHPANSKSCTKYQEEQAILRYRASNGGTFKQACAAVVVNVAKEIRPKLYAGGAGDVYPSRDDIRDREGISTLPTSNSYNFIQKHGRDFLFVVLETRENKPFCDTSS